MFKFLKFKFKFDSKFIIEEDEPKNKHKSNTNPSIAQDVKIARPTKENLNVHKTIAN